MIYITLILLTLKMTSIWTLPMQSDLQRLQHPSTTSQRALQQETPMTSEQSQQEPRHLYMTSQLQSQLLALQQMQAIHKLNTVHAPSNLYVPQPFMVLFPNLPIQENEVSNVIEEENDKNTEAKHKNYEKGYEDEDLESVIIDAETKEEQKVPQRAVVLVPSSRVSIGQIISGIPWLPFEVNVPDTIAWAWNGISSGIAGIISIIGQRLPFRSRLQMNVISDSQGANVKMLLNQMHMKQLMMPILVAPLQRPMLPI